MLLAGVLAASWAITRWSNDRGPWERLPARVGECGIGRGWTACAIDGDTLSIARSDGPPRRVRLLGYDAPELDGACAAERALALRARSELATWLSDGRAELDGGADPPRDRYGRELRRARRSGADGESEWLDEHMVRAGLARGEGRDRDTGWCG